MNPKVLGASAVGFVQQGGLWAGAVILRATPTPATSIGPGFPKFHYATNSDLDGVRTYCGTGSRGPLTHDPRSYATTWLAACSNDAL